MQKKDWDENKVLFVKILRETKNGSCADVIEDAKNGNTDKIMQKRKNLRRNVNANKANLWRVLPIIVTISVLSIAVLLQYMNSNVSTSPSSPVSVVQDKTTFINHDNNVPTKKGDTIVIKQEDTVHQQIWFEITAPNRFYVRRDKEMDLLEGYWNTSMTQKTLSIVAVTGLGGVGKSELAKNYAKSFYENVEGHCIWIKAESNQSVEESFRSLAERNLKIPLNDNLGREKKFLQIVEEVFEKLFGEKVLFVFDNIQNYELPVFQLLINLSSKKPPKVLKPFLITTSRAIEANKYFGTLCNTLDLQVLTKESAKQFFYNSLNVNEPPEGNIKELIEKLCERLHFFPLAMQQAAAYIKEKFIFSGDLYEAIENYLDQMENISKNLLNHKLPKYDSSISTTTFLTWRITFNTLREESGGLAIEIMNIISFLSPDNIPTQMVTNIVQKMGVLFDVGNIDNFFELIRKFSMINFSGEKSISVHRLVQEVTRIKLEERGEFLSILNEVANCMKEMLIEKEMPLKDLVQVQVVWEHLRGDKAMTEKHRELPRLICQKYFDSGRYRDLLEFSIESGDLLESVLGQDSRLTLQMKYFKGVSLRELGEYFESIEVLNHVYEMEKDIFGEEDEGCLKTANDMGAAYYGLKKYMEAMRIYQNALEINERINGKEHRGTLTLKNGIAAVLRAQNKYNEALKIYKEILNAEERLLGVEHPSTLTTRHNIAAIKFEQKDYSEALKKFQDVLEIKERILESNHPNTLNTKYGIALTYHHLGRHQESLRLFQEVRANSVQILGLRHPDTIDTERWIEKIELHIALLASSITGFSSILSDLPTFVMDMFNAKDISLEELVDIQIIWKHLITDKEMNEESGRSLSEICTNWQNSGKYKNLFDFSSKFGELVESVLTQNNRWVLRMKYWKGVALKGLVQYSESMEVLKDVWKIQKMIFGEEYDDSLDAATQIGNVYYRLNKYEEAMQIYENILEKRLQILGKEHEETLLLKTSISLVLQAQGKHEEALELNIEILELRERLFGVDNPTALNNKRNIAFLRFKQKNYVEALRDFKEVLKLEEGLQKLNHPSSLITKYYIGEAYYHLGEYVESLERFKEIHEIEVLMLGPRHQQTIDTEELIKKVETVIALQRSATEF